MKLNMVFQFEHMDLDARPTPAQQNGTKDKMDLVELKKASFPLADRTQ